MPDWGTLAPVSAKHCYALRVAYDGTAFAGFQRQPPLPTIQEALETALSRLGVPARIEGGGRTDAGVHARAQVVTFRTPAALDAATLPRRLAPLLPPGLLVVEAAQAPWSFHARFSAREKEYRYRVTTGPAPTTTEERFTWTLPDPRGFPDLEGEVRTLDEAAMREALAACEGWHDFRQLAHPRSTGKTRRLLLQADLFVRPREAGGCRYEFVFRSPGFLRHQVRNLVGVAVTAGLGRLPAGALEGLLSGKGDRWRGARAPGRGLTLWAVRYPPDEDPFAPEGSGGIDPLAAAEAAGGDPFGVGAGGAAAGDPSSA